MDRVVEDVIEGFLVLPFGLDHSGPEASSEDVVLPAVPFVEGAGVFAVQVTHALGEVRLRRLDEQVVVVAEQAAGVQAPAVAPPYATKELNEHGAIPVVAEDRLVVVALRSDVVVGAGLEVAMRSSHGGDRSGGRRDGAAMSASWRRRVTDLLRARHETPPQRPRRTWAGRRGRRLGGDFGALEVLVRRAVVAFRKRRALARLPLPGRRPTARDAAV